MRLKRLRINEEETWRACCPVIRSTAKRSIVGQRLAFEYEFPPGQFDRAVERHRSDRCSASLSKRQSRIGKSTTKNTTFFSTSPQRSAQKVEAIFRSTTHVTPFYTLLSYQCQFLLKALGECVNREVLREEQKEVRCLL